MNINLSWDLVALALLILIFAYNFLLGQKTTIKVIISSYMAILTADGIADFFKKFIFDLSPGIHSMVMPFEDELYMGVRIGIFVIAILVLVIKGGFKIHLENHNHWAIRTSIHALFAILSAILFLSTLLIYISGSSFVDGILHAKEISIYEQSLFAKIFIDYYQVWFTLPALSFLLASMFFDPEEV